MSSYNLLAQEIDNSGDSVVFPNAQGATHFTMSLSIAGAPSASSILIYGTLAGVDTLLETYTANVNKLDEHRVDPTVYDSFKVTATWTGGTSVSIGIDCTLIVDETIVSSGDPLFIPITILLHGDYNFLHGLGVAPTKVTVTETSSGLVRFQASVFPPWDDTYIYLNSSDDNVQALLMVEE
jgi:hypothetical protein